MKTLINLFLCLILISIHHFFCFSKGNIDFIITNEEKMVLDNTILQYCYNNEWQDSEITSYLYDTIFNPIEEIKYEIIKSQNIPIYKYSNTYTKNILTIQVYSEYIIDKWEEIFKSDFQYNEYGSLIKKTEYKKVNNNWNLFRIWENYFNSNNMLSRKLIRENINNNFITIQDIDYFYNNQSLLVKSEVTEYDRDVNTLTYKLYSYSHNQKKQMIEKLFQKKINGNYINISRNLYNYNNLDSLNVLIIQDWNGNIWLNVTKTNYFYDDKNQLINEKRSDWIENKWEQYFDRYLKYDEFGNNTEDLAKTKQGDEIKNYARYIYNYKKITDISNEINQSKIELFPNPIRDVAIIIFNLNVQVIPNIRIYSQGGFLLKSINFGYLNPGSHRFQLDCSDLPSGVYFYTFKAGTEVMRGKFVVVR